MLEESVVYQDILQKGRRRGLQEGRQEGAEEEARKVATRLLELRFGKLSRSVQRQVERLVVEQLEALCEAQINFQTKDDLNRWLKQHAPAR